MLRATHTKKEYKMPENNYYKVSLQYTLLYTSRNAQLPTGLTQMPRKINKSHNASLPKKPTRQETNQRKQTF